MAVTFLLMDTPGSSAGLQDARPTAADGMPPWRPIYTAAGRSYPAFVSLVLVPPLLAAVRSRLPRLVRAGALLVFLGAVFAVLSFPAVLGPGRLGRRAQHSSTMRRSWATSWASSLFWFSGLIAKHVR